MEILASSTPSTWADPDPITWMHTLLVFVGIPLALALVITLVVVAPSVVKGPRYRPGISWWAESEWFGGPEVLASDHTPALEPGTNGHSSVVLGGGGASARW